MSDKVTQTLPVLQPRIYDNFRCIAGDCSLTCCQEWIIHVDDVALHRWQRTELEGNRLSHTVERDPDGSHRIRLREDHRCPWLNGDNLCRLVLNFGEEMLSQTCASFPRQVRRFEDRLERNLLTGCPEVLDLLRKSGVYDLTWGPGESDADRPDGAEELFPLLIGSDMQGRSAPDSSPVDHDDRLTLCALRLAREGICCILADEDQTIESALVLAFYMLTELWEHEPEADVVEYLLHTMSLPEEWNQISRKLELSPQAVCSHDTLMENNELFLDLCENHMQEKKYESVLRPLYHQAQRLAEAFTDASPDPSGDNGIAAFVDASADHPECNAVSSGFNLLMRQILIADCRAALLSETPNLDAMILNFVWITLRYAAIRHALNLMYEGNMPSPFTAQGETDIWSAVRQLICVIERMTGCSEEDSHAYMTYMFGSDKVDLSYMRLLLGV